MTGDYFCDSVYSFYVGCQGYNCHYVKITSSSIGRSGQHGEVGLTADVSASSGVQRTEQKRYFIEPSRFTKLKRGGAANNYEVEAVAYCDGKLFGEDKGMPLPYKLLTFRQK